MQFSCSMFQKDVLLYATSDGKLLTVAQNEERKYKQTILDDR